MAGHSCWGVTVQLRSSGEPHGPFGLRNLCRFSHSRWWRLGMIQPNHARAEPILRALHTHLQPSAGDQAVDSHSKRHSSFTEPQPQNDVR